MPSSVVDGVVGSGSDVVEAGKVLGNKRPRILRRITADTGRAERGRNAVRVERPSTEVVSHFAELRIAGPCKVLVVDGHLVIETCSEIRAFDTVQS